MNYLSKKFIKMVIKDIEKVILFEKAKMSSFP